MIDLQSLYYIVSITFMVTLIFVLIASLFILIRIKQYVQELQTTAVDKISSVANKAMNVRSIASFVFSTFVLNRARKWFQKEG